MVITGLPASWLRDANPDISVYEAYFLLCSAIVLLVSLGAAVARAHKESLQELRDREIVADGPVALFLRPFYSDRRLRFPSPFWDGSQNISHEFHTLTPSEYVGRVLEPYIIVRQFGGSPETFANARLWAPVVGAAWKDALQREVAEAAIVIIIPMLGRLTRRSEPRGTATLWELGYLLDGALDRTVVVMPTTTWFHRVAVRRSWERARAHASSLGLELPRYDKHGDVMTFARVRGAWTIDRYFGQPCGPTNHLAVGLVDAVNWLAKRHGFALVSR